MSPEIKAGFGPGLRPFSLPAFLRRSRADLRLVQAV